MLIFDTLLKDKKTRENINFVRKITKINKNYNVNVTILGMLIGVLLTGFSLGENNIVGAISSLVILNALVIVATLIMDNLAFKYHIPAFSFYSKIKKLLPTQRKVILELDKSTDDVYCKLQELDAIHKMKLELQNYRANEDQEKSIAYLKDGVEYLEKLQRENKRGESVYVLYQLLKQYQVLMNLEELNMKEMEMNSSIKSLL